MVVLTVLICVVVPLTVRFPVTVTLLDAVIEPVTARVEPLNVRLPLSSIAPAVPANTTRPDVRSDTFALANVDSPLTPSVVPTVREPATAAFSSTSSVSICAVPSRCKSIHSNVDVPKSLAPSVEGTKSLSKRPVAVIVSLVAFPKSTFPFATNAPLAVTVPDAVTAPVTPRVEPSNVRFPESSISPSVPANTTRPDVRSDTFADEATKPAPPEMLAPPLPSIIPPNVPIPVTFIAANVAPLDPPKIESDNVSNVTFLFVPPAPSSTMNRSASASVVVAVAPSISRVEIGVVPAVNPEPDPANDVALRAPVLELNVRLLPLFAPRFPVAAVANSGKHVVSDDSSATVIVVPTVAESALPDTSPVKSPTNPPVAVATPVTVRSSTVVSD